MPKFTGNKGTVESNEPPGKTIRARENQIISLAYDLIEQRIKNGTATSQEVTTLIKMGSSIAQLEKAKLEKENLLLQAKTEQIESQKRIEELYTRALEAMKRYSGNGSKDDST